MGVTYFKSRKFGPESLVEDKVAEELPCLFRSPSEYSWIAGSAQIGAGLPDLLFVNYRSNLHALATVETSPHEILAYLRAVRVARIETIADRLSTKVVMLQPTLESLCEVKIIEVSKGNYSLSSDWRNILPEVIAVEVKISDWRKALQQAYRNRILAHRSFIALPHKIAQKVSTDVTVSTMGVGVISVSENHQVEIVLEAERSCPTVWSYYYKLASLAANHATKENRKNGVQSRHRNGSETLSRV